MKNKIFINYSLQSLIYILLLISCNSCNNSSPKQAIIGCNLTLTGSNSYVSMELQKGINIAYNTFDEKDRKKVKITYEDNEFKPNKSVNIFSKLITVDKANIIICAHTPISMPLRESAEKSKTPFLATFTSASKFAKSYNWVYRDFQTQDKEAKTIAEYTFNILKLKRGTYIVINDDYGLDGASIFSNTFKKMGGSISNGQEINQGEFEFRNTVYKALQDKPEFVFVVAREKVLASICKMIRENNKEIQILGTTAFDTKVVWDQLGEIGNNIIYSSTYIDYEKSEEAKYFKKSYVEQFKINPTYVAVYGYTIGKYMIDILIKTGPDNEKINEELGKLKIESIRGYLETNSIHDIASTLGIYKRQNNQPNLIEIVK